MSVTESYGLERLTLNSRQPECQMKLRRGSFMRTLYRWVLPLLLAGCASSLCFAKTCTPQFQLEQNNSLGWQGADAAYSIPLSGARDVWIFGDTLYGKKRVVNGHAPRMVHNSLGISTCDANGNFHLKYVIRRGPQGNAESFFSPQNPDHWYWALDGFVNKGDLWVTLLCIRHAAKQSPWAMDFATCGSDLAKLSHLDRDPQQWSVQYYPLVPDGVKAYPSASAVVDGNYSYLFGLYESGSRPLLATRIPLSGLNDPAKNLEYLTTAGEWKNGFHPQSAKAVMEKGSTELSIRYHPELKKWFAVMFTPDGFSGKILLRTAPRLTGPWTDGQVIYSVPEMQPDKPGYDKDTFCYAGKEHPEFESGDLVFTYVCNTMSVPKLATNLKIYFPQVVRMQMPVSPQ
jgi:hypothetical protein